MSRSDKLWLWVTAVSSIVMGYVLVLNDTAAGWFLIFLGLTYIFALSRDWSEMDRLQS